MQQLGLSPNAPKTQSRLRELFWPEIADEIAAQTAARNGMYASFAIAVFSTLFVAIGLIPAATLLDALFFVLIGIGIKRMSRAAAVAGLTLYIIEQVYAFAHGRGGWNVILMAIFIALFLSAVRASFWHHRARAH